MKKTSLSFLIPVFFALACGHKAHEHEGHDEATAPDATEATGNQLLYEKVMKVHDEVMPKLNDIYTLKETLKDKIANTPSMAEAKKKDIEQTIVQLDSASENMMVWMRAFNAPPDSLGEEKAREYLEGQMEKVQKVKTDILESIEKAKAQ
jgi:hypothetical protein